VEVLVAVGYVRRQARQQSDGRPTVFLRGFMSNAVDMELYMAEELGLSHA